jgi:glycosyltransferase involved in cell wall biosynthesis
VKVLIVSGIWPPDVGGPASHAPELATWLRGRGHDVEVVVTADSPPAPQPYPVRWASRHLPRGIRHLRALTLVAQRARQADVVYATSMTVRSAAATALARKPLVVKVTSDPAFERARRQGLVGGDVAGFQSGGGGMPAAILRLLRDLSVRRAAHVVCPSAFLRDVIVSWHVPAERVTVLPNASPRANGVEPAALGQPAPFVFAGRLTTAKDVDTTLEAVARVPAASLVVVGDGPERARLEQMRDGLGLRDRVDFVGPTSRDGVLAYLRGAEAMVLSSAWENFPHGVVEALALGTPVIATSVGGVPEIVTDGENGLLVPPGDAGALASAISRYLDDPSLRSRLRAAAAPSVARYDQDEIYGRLERILEAAAA